MVNWTAGVLRVAAENVVGLVVDDGLVVAGAALALGITWALSRSDLVPSVVVGVVLFLLVAASLVVSLLRAARDARRQVPEVIGPPSADQG